MKKTTRRMFVPETIRVLDSIQLRAVDGGRSGPACPELSEKLTNCQPRELTLGCAD